MKEASKKSSMHVQIDMLKGAKFKRKFGGTFKKMDIKYKKFQYKFLAHFKLKNLSFNLLIRNLIKMNKYFV